MSTENTPKIRFEGFTDAWKQRKLSEVAEKICVGFVGTCEKYYTDTSGIPMYRTGNLNGLKLNQDDLKYVTKEFHEQNKKSQLRKGDILIARHGDSGKAVNYELSEEANCLNIVIIRPDLDKCNYQFLSDSINSPTVSQHIKSLSAGSTQAVINTSEIEKLDIIIPANKEEQNKIAGFLNDLDNLITLHQRKCEEIKILKKSMLQKMFPKEGERFPEIRFPGFTDAWEQRKFDEWGDFYYGHSCPKWSVTEDATTPCIRYGELYTKFGAKIDKVYSYTNMPPEKLRFSKGTEVLIPRVGEDPMDYNHCTWLSLKGVAIGEMISVFNTDQDPLFSATMFNATLQKEFAIRVEGGSVTNLYFDKLKNIDISYPSLPEQKKIAAFFDNLDNLITLHQRKCEELIEMKKFMLQNMFC